MLPFPDHQRPLADLEVNTDRARMRNLECENILMVMLPPKNAARPIFTQEASPSALDAGSSGEGPSTAINHLQPIASASSYSSMCITRCHAAITDEQRRDYQSNVLGMPATGRAQQRPRAGSPFCAAGAE